MIKCWIKKEEHAKYISNENQQPLWKLSNQCECKTQVRLVWYNVKLDRFHKITDALTYQVRSWPGTFVGLPNINNVQGFNTMKHRSGGGGIDEN